MNSISKLNKRNAVILFGVLLLGLAILAPINSVTREIVIKREEEEKMRVIGQILPPELYDNRLLRDSVKAGGLPFGGQSRRAGRRAARADALR